jgi:hypothetical protein
MLDASKNHSIGEADPNSPPWLRRGRSLATPGWLVLLTPRAAVNSY